MCAFFADQDHTLDMLDYIIMIKQTFYCTKKESYVSSKVNLARTSIKCVIFMGPWPRLLTRKKLPKVFHLEDLSHPESRPKNPQEVDHPRGEKSHEETVPLTT